MTAWSWSASSTGWKGRSRLLTATERDALPGQQLIGVIRKGTRDYQQLPASPDAFVWLRLYQEEAWGKGVPRGRNQPLWWTLRRPRRPLTYDAARAMFNRAVELLVANWTLHDLRHTAPYLMTEDPEMSLAHVQHILGHKLALGSCGRAYGTDCIHEHACVRCPVLIVDPNERRRLVKIHENWNDWIVEAECEGWLGDVERLSVSRDAAKEKVDQLVARQKKKESPVFTGIPSFSQVAVRTSFATNED
ncbi:tyrosine-type recombinase/integrase [Streptomyces sp. NPDC050856]|uniref:tyrosine-type recombinase/integrase n=1 Tax=Streptomyces sp. NPDC050856 TaxID=3154939 RepID=UPI0033CC931F